MMKYLIIILCLQHICLSLKDVIDSEEKLNPLSALQRDVRCHKKKKVGGGFTPELGITIKNSTIYVDDNEEDEENKGKKGKGNPLTLKTKKPKRMINEKNFDWCTLNCQKSEHVACVADGHCKPASPCDLPLFDPRPLVEEHNKLRDQFARGETDETKGLTVGDMNAVDWDWDLAYTAACNLKECKDYIEPDYCHTTTNHETVGQNLAWTKGIDTPCEEQVIEMTNTWVNEIRKTNKAAVEKLANGFELSPGVGNFSQLVWSKVTHIGCAVTSKPLNGNETICSLACNYAPAGNIIGESMFIQGPPASKCENGKQANAKYPGLCGEGYTQAKLKLHTEIPS